MDEQITPVSITLNTPDNSKVSFTHSAVAPLAGFLNAHSQADTAKLERIADFFRGSKTEFSDIDLLQAVRHLETKLGTPKIGERRVDVLYQYVKLQSQIDDLDSELKSLLR